MRFYEGERAYLVKAEYCLRSAFAMFEIEGFQGGPAVAGITTLRSEQVLRGNGGEFKKN